MKKKLLLLTPLMLGLMLSACGTSDTPTPTSSSEESSEETTSSQQTSNAQGTSSTAQSSSVAGQSSSAEATSSATAQSSSTAGQSSSAEATSSAAEQSSSEAGTSSSAPAVTQYTITFNSKGGSDVTAITQDKGSSISKPTDPERNGYNFVGWSYDEGGSQPVEWPVTLNSNLTVYANWNEKVNIKQHLQNLIASIHQDPYSYIPEKMRPETTTHYEESTITYDFSSFVNVSNIHYGGYGEQWNTVIENIQESENFYKVLNLGEALINASVVLFNNYLDSNTSDTGSHTLNETEYTAKINFSTAELKYSIRYKTNMNIPFFGEVTPQVDMCYQLVSGLRSVRIQLNETNALKYEVSPNSYSFAISYGVTTVTRKALFEINNNDGNIDGHINEYVQYKDKELVPSAADFYIDDTYVSVVGNKASGITGFTGYINELYLKEQGKLLGYKVRETFSKWGFEKTYNTLWFNLNDIENIESVKAVSNGSADPHENNHDIYLNGSGSIFTPKKNKKLLVETSRKYDVEMRKQYFFDLDGENKVVTYERSIPMMFIQDDGELSGEDNYSTFEADISSTNGINAHVLLNAIYLTKIREDYLTLIDLFDGNKDMYDGDYIDNFIGTAEVIA